MILCPLFHRIYALQKGLTIIQNERDGRKKNMNPEKFSKPLELKDVKICDAFWGGKQELVRTEVIPYQWEALNDRVEGAAPSYCMRNFKNAGRILEEQRKGIFIDPKDRPGEEGFDGFVFQDSDFAKWIEAVGYSLVNHPDKELEAVADGAIDIVCAAQADNGYLDTFYIINGMDGIFKNLKDRHELYCFGHLLEGAIAYYQATGKDKLLKAAMRYGVFVSTCFGPEEGKLKGYPGHEIAEMALARLYELTGEKSYLDLSCFFLNMRGTDPNYFVNEEKRNAENDKRSMRPVDLHYHQAHMPVRAQREAVGHAVRAVYLYSGMADVARLTLDEEMLEACRGIWESIVNEKLYITGGIGGTRLGEAFSFPYDLPNDTAYSETCAAIGLVFFARRMLQIAAKNEYADVMEQALYNTVLAGMALDGKSFFYVNPLEVLPIASARDGRKAHVKSVRQKWFGCACCPPNIARLVSSVGSYAYTENETTLFTHLYMGGSLKKQFADGEMRLVSKSDLPFDGTYSVKLNCEKPCAGTLAFRIPGWCGKTTLTLTRGGSSAKLSVDNKGNILAGDLKAELIDGYLYLTDTWQDGDAIDMDFAMEVRVLQANTRVREDMGKIAFMRGPVCYCFEEADNGSDLHLLRADAKAVLAGDFTIEKDSSLEKNMAVIKLPGFRRAKTDAKALYTAFTGTADKEESPCTLTLVPYSVWNNRGEGEMTVWIGV